MSAQRNDRQLKSVVVSLGSPSTDLTVPALYCRRKIQIVGVAIANGASIAASDTNYAQISLFNGSTELAELDTRAAHENGLTANVFKALNLVSAALSIVAAGESLKATYNETDSGTSIAATNLVMQIDYYELETA